MDDAKHNVLFRRPGETTQTMHIFTAKDSTPLAHKRPAATLGVFDGVHRGHQTILASLTATAREFGAPSLAITFAQHPRQTLGRSAPPAITTLERRLELMAEAGLDAVWVLDFTPEIAALPGREFAEEYFHRRLHASAVILGEAARFGKGRDGAADSLADWSADWEMTVKATPAFLIDGVKVSSTGVRLAVLSGALDQAASSLGRPFSVIGTVVHGQGLAKPYGFPTLNLDPHHELRPPAGVYITKAYVEGNEYASITNVGRPPTDAEIDAGLGDLMIETHLLDYSGDLYGTVAEIAFYEKTRDAMRFANPADLIAQVHRDMAQVRQRFANETITDQASTPASQHTIIPQSAPPIN